MREVVTAVPVSSLEAPREDEVLSIEAPAHVQ
jgi:hypothetical protein